MKRPIPAARYWSREIPLPASVDILLLAGGKGTRLSASLRPELRKNPKLLLSIDSDGRHEPMLDTAIRRLIRYGFMRISLLTCSDEAACGEAIECHAASEFGPLPSLRVFREDHPLGTAGAVYAALKHLEAQYAIVVPGDTLFPFEKLMPGLVRHASWDAAITWFVTTQPGDAAQNRGRLVVDSKSGDLLIAAEGHEFDLAPHLDLQESRATSAGVVIVNAARFKAIFERVVTSRQLTSVDLHRQVIPWALDHSVTVKVFDIRQPAHDLGTPERLLAFGCSEPPSVRVSNSTNA